MNKIYKLGILIGFLTLVLVNISCSQGTNQPGSSTPVISQTPGSTPGTKASQPTVIASTVTPALPKTPAGEESTVTELVTLAKMAQRNEGNAVTIEAIPQSKLMVGSKELVFNVTLDTHSVDLDVYDLTALATLRDSHGRQFKATSWNAPKGGHHRSGTLGFKSDQPLLQPDTKYIELLIKDVAKVPERILRWEFRPAGS